MMGETIGGWRIPKVSGPVLVTGPDTSLPSVPPGPGAFAPLKGLMKVRSHRDTPCGLMDRNSCQPVASSAASSGTLSKARFTALVMSRLTSHHCLPLTQ